VIKLGQSVKDAVTGFEGIATRRTESLHGSTQFLVEGRDCGYRRDEWIEEGRLRAANEPAVSSVTEIRQPSARPPT
jgi:hypothetical protein